MNPNTASFLETVLWTGNRDSDSVHDFHPEFVAAVNQFLTGFRAYLAEHHPDLDPDGGSDARSFGGSVYLSLSGHGSGFWDDSDSGWGKAMQSALEEYSSGLPGRARFPKYRFEELDRNLYKFHGKIHLSFRTATYRREHLARIFGLETLHR